MIRALEADIRSHLRSGVAVSSLTQAVDELVTNALDAGSTCVTVRVNIPEFRVQVTDNGSGVTRDDLALLGERYSTSKCHSLGDLRRLKSYGFRGEALASIRDICGILEIVTKHKSSYKTYCKVFRSGKTLDVTESCFPRSSAGTTVTIHDIFSSLPVRKKLLSGVLDFERVRHRLASIALIHPEVSFTLFNDATGQKCLQTRKCLSASSTFSQLFGNMKAKSLREVSCDNKQFIVTGHIGIEPHHSKGLQFLYVNGRLLLKTRIHKLVNSMVSKSTLLKQSFIASSSEEGQESKSPPQRPSDRYAIFILNISCSVMEYDITLEPAKTLVEFEDWTGVLSAVQMCIEGFFAKEGLVEMPVVPDSQVLNEDELSQDSTDCDSQHELIDLTGYEYQSANGNEIKYGRDIDTSNIRRSLHSSVVTRQVQQPLQPVDNSLEKHLPERTQLNVLMENHTSTTPASDTLESSARSASCKDDSSGESDSFFISDDAEVTSGKSTLREHEEAFVSVTTCVTDVNMGDPIASKQASVTDISPNNSKSQTLPTPDVFNSPNPIMLQMRTNRKRSSSKVSPFVPRYTASKRCTRSDNSKKQGSVSLLNQPCFKKPYLNDQVDDFSKAHLSDKSNSNKESSVKRFAMPKNSSATKIKNLNTAGMSSYFLSDKVSSCSVQLRAPEDTPLSEDKDSMQELSQAKAQQENPQNQCVGSEIPCKDSLKDSLPLELRNIDIEMCCDDAHKTLESLDQECNENWGIDINQESSQNKHSDIITAENIDDFIDVTCEGTSNGYDDGIMYRNSAGEMDVVKQSTGLHTTDSSVSSPVGLSVNKPEQIQNTANDVDGGVSTDQSNSTSSVLAPSWTSRFDSHSGRKLFVNLKTGHTSFEDPEKQSIACAADGEGMEVDSHCSHVPLVCAPHVSFDCTPWLPRGQRSRIPADQGRILHSEVDPVDKSSDSIPVLGGDIFAMFNQWTNPVFGAQKGMNVMTLGRAASGTVRMLSAIYPYQFTKDMFSRMEVINQVDDKFIVCLVHGEPCSSEEDSDGLLVLIDQHAAHERVRLETFTKDLFTISSEADDNPRIKSLPISPPIELELPSEDLRLVKSYRSEMERIGIRFVFGSEPSTSRVIVHELPAAFVEREASEVRRRRPSVAVSIVKELIQEHLEHLKRTCGVGRTIPKTVLRVLCSQACHGAIKFGDPLALHQCQELIEDLSQCKLPFQCAHGRPSTIPLLDLQLARERFLPQEKSTPRLSRLSKMQRSPSKN